MTGLTSSEAMLAAISAWIDESPANKDRTPLEAFLLRAIKVQEESGEMVSNIIGMTGQNPRKGVTANLEDVLDEAADTALTALAFIEHATGNKGEALKILFFKIAKVHGRMFETPPTEQIPPNERIDKVLGVPIAVRKAEFVSPETVVPPR